MTRLPRKIVANPTELGKANLIHRRVLFLSKPKNAKPLAIVR